MTPSWYDVLGVDEDASDDEVRAAWQDGIAGLEPGDRRFKQRSRAAEVLLDPERRAAHDAELATRSDETDETDELADSDETAEAAEAGPDVAGQPQPRAGAGRREGTSASAASTVVLDKRGRDRPDARVDRLAPAAVTTRSPRGRLRWPVAVLAAVLAVVLLAATVLALALGAGSDEGGLPDEREVAAAQRAAEEAVGPVLSYDFRDLEGSRAAALTFMTPGYAEIYEESFDAIVADGNAVNTKTIVTAEVVTSGVVRTGEDRVDVLVFVDRPIRNKSRDDLSSDQVTLRMLDVDGEWLVDCLLVRAGDPCPD